MRYLHLTIRPYDRLGGDLDPVRRRPKRVTLVGPSELSTSSTSSTYSGEFDNLWLSAIVSCVRLTAVRAGYMDGTERSWVHSVDTPFEDATDWDRCP